MARNVTFDREDPLPSYWANVIQDILSGAVFDFQIKALDSNTIQVVPRQPTGLAAMIIQGRWRFNTTTIQRDVPGNGLWRIWAVALDNDVDDSPDPFTDHTTYTWDLRMTADGVDPSGTGVEIFERIGSLNVSGGVIDWITQEAFSISGNQIENQAIGSRQMAALATANVTQESPFDVGSANSATVTRTAEGLVLLDGFVEGGSISSNTTALGVVPAGFRPAGTIYRVDTAGRVFTINPSGQIRLVTGIGPFPSLTVRFPGLMWKAA